MVPESDGKSLARDEVCILHLDYAAVIVEMLVASKKVVQHMASWSDSEWELSWSGWFFKNSRSNEPAEGEWPQSDFIKRWALGSLTLQDFDRLHPEPDQRVNACLASSDDKDEFDIHNWEEDRQRCLPWRCKVHSSNPCSTKRKDIVTQYDSQFALLQIISNLEE